MDAKKLADTRDYLCTWLERCRQANNAAPTVQRIHDLLDWEVRTVEKRPAEAKSISTTELDRYSEMVYGRIKSALPMLPEIPPEQLTTVSSSSAVSSTVVITYVSEISQLQTLEAMKYASNALLEYRELQESQQRPNQVRELLANRMPNVIQKFDTACIACQRCQSRIGDMTVAALEMRTLIDGVKGELYERARQYPKENMKLDLVLERLFSSATTKLEIEEQFKQRSSLYEALSAVAKRRNPPMMYELEALWARVLDYILVVVGGLPRAGP